MLVIDHTNEHWNLRYTRHGRENGAATYSRELVRYHVPIWQKYAPNDTVVSTVPLITSRSQFDIPENTKLLVQYLHRYPYEDYLADVKRVVRVMGDIRIIFVVAYQQFATVLRAKGYEALYLPMTIDAAEVRKHAAPKKIHGPKTIAYFGNLLHGKENVYPNLKWELTRRGYSIDTFANGQYNNSPLKLTQAEIWERLSEYEYGIGVGRCALEMYALGLKVLIVGGQWGGLCMDGNDFVQQLGSNLNGRVITFDRELQPCLDALPHSAVITSDIKETLPAIQNAIAGVLL